MILAYRLTILGCGVMVAASAAHGQSRWREANALVGALGGWRAYVRERAEPPPGYPSAPRPEDALLPDAVLAAPPTPAMEGELAAWEGRQLAGRSVPLAPPTVSYARKSGDPESSQEIGVHLPLGAWIQRARSMAADSATWGRAERQALELQDRRARLAAYAAAVTAKAELAQALDRLEVLQVLDELTRRQRETGAVPEGELLGLRIERAEGEDAAAAAQEAALRAAEGLALHLGRPLGEALEIQRRLPLELPTPGDPLAPALAERLDVRMAEDALAQARSVQSRSGSAPWLGGLELGLLQERTDKGQTANTVELRWRLPFGGDTGRQAELDTARVRQIEFQVRATRLAAEREQAEAARAKVLTAARLKQAEQAVTDAEAWMEEQVYRYSGMLLSPHGLLRAAARLRAVRSRYIAARQAAFLAEVDAHFAQAIPLRPVELPAAAPAAAPAARETH